MDQHDGLGGLGVRALPAPAVAQALAAWLDVSGEYFANMAKVSGPQAPWGSKGSINAAGEAIRAGKLTVEGAGRLDVWRASHRSVLNTFQAILRNRTRGTGIVVAQRLKRRLTITDKLLREPKMQLARMDDVAGCRLIFPDLKSLDTFRGAFQWARFKHTRKNDLSKYDYIKHPKSLGYRGIHDIYEYETSSRKGAQFKGLLLELQYRTRCQHAWATAVELMTQFTPNEPKFNRGDAKHIEFFKLASEVIARTKENLVSCHAPLTNPELAGRFEDLDREINVMAMLRLAKPSIATAEDGRAVILQIGVDGLRVHAFQERGAATAALFKLEKDWPNDDIVLVSADTFENIRSAYRNYFSDVGEFVTYVEEGCKALRSRSDN